MKNNLLVVLIGLFVLSAAVADASCLAYVWNGSRGVKVNTAQRFMSAQSPTNYVLSNNITEQSTSGLTWHGEGPGSDIYNGAYRNLELTITANSTNPNDGGTAYVEIYDAQYNLLESWSQFIGYCSVTSP